MGRHFQTYVLGPALPNKKLELNIVVVKAAGLDSSFDEQSLFRIGMLFCHGTWMASIEHFFPLELSEHFD